MKTKLNVGIIGLGWPGEQHAKALATSDLGQLYAAADLSAERKAKFQAQFPARKLFSGFEELLADPNVDVVIVTLPNSLHFPASLAALQAGKHVLCEKPPTMNAAEMRVLHEEALARKLIYFFGRQFRFSPAMLAARALVEAGRLGSVYFGKAIWVRARGVPGGIDGWFTEKARSGGGALIDLGVHALDGAWYLMGTPRPISVSAQVFTNFRNTSPAKVFDVEDAAYGMIRFENGALIHFEVSWAANLTDEASSAGFGGRELTNTILYGNKGTIRLNPLALFEDHAGTLVDVAIEPKGNANSFSAQLENFLRSVRGEAQPVNSSEQAVRLMDLIDAIYTSSSTGREVVLSPA
jgi:predicted dehydrogenase